MGFFPTATEVVLREHRFRPITGRALMIGRHDSASDADNPYGLSAYQCQTGVPV
jgi:hypothetical protein